MGPKAWQAHRKTVVTFVVMLLIAASAALPAAPADARARDESFEQSIGDGFHDPANKFAWSMAWFKGKLYVGTNRNFRCVEQATLDFYIPGTYHLNMIPGVSCPANKYDIELQAEIWRYTPEQHRWDRVFKSPNDLPNPAAPGKFVARDIGFRGMTVLKDGDRDEALVVGGVTVRQYLPSLPPPRLLRTTDGEHFEPIPLNQPALIQSAEGDVPPIGFRAMEVFDGRLFVSASIGLVGDGVLLEVDDPTGPAPRFRQVTPRELRVYEMAVFNHQLYIGTGSDETGYGVYRTRATGPAPYHFTPVIVGGAGRGPIMTSVVSMFPFKGRLYVGSNGALPGVWVTSELIRINPDDSWQLVVGKPRNTPRGQLSPISGLPDSFGNIFNAHFWRMQQDDRQLFLGTNDTSWVWGRVFPFLDPLLRFEYGFDLFATRNGRFWRVVTRDGFGGNVNFGARTMASTPIGFFIGTANHLEGAEVWLDERERRWRGSSAHGWRNREEADSGPNLAGRDDDEAAAPGRLTAEVVQGATVLAWDPALGVRRYHVFRAAFRPLGAAAALPAANVPLTIEAARPAPPAARIEAAGVPGDAMIAEPYVEIGRTTSAFFRDASATAGGTYAYYVVASGREADDGATSNVAVVPPITRAVTFDDVEAGTNGLPGLGPWGGRSIRAGLPEGAGGSATDVEFRTLVAGAREAVRAGRAGEAVGKLQLVRLGLQRELRDSPEALDAEDLETTIGLLERRVTLVRDGVLPADSVTDGVAPGPPGRKRRTIGSPSWVDARPLVAPSPQPTPSTRAR